MNAYAGIGSRATPEPICTLMTEIAKRLAGNGWMLRSGHARGADQAFERGAVSRAEIYLPWERYESGVLISGRLARALPSIDAVALARRLHPQGDYLTGAHLALHGRNAHIILGETLRDPVDFVLCWTPDGSIDGSSRDAGGTGGALRIAAEYNIRAFNLARPEHYSMVFDYLTSEAVSL